EGKRQDGRERDPEADDQQRPPHDDIAEPLEDALGFGYVRCPNRRDDSSVLRSGFLPFESQRNQN
ncbi:MAG: hypothetical protein QOH34_2013, partial [Mycobacterium sp.]|nr:hypothetical protein [Mycobacterium sp.]